MYSLGRREEPKIPARIEIVSGRSPSRNPTPACPPARAWVSALPLSFHCEMQPKRKKLDLLVTQKKRVSECDAFIHWASQWNVRSRTRILLFQGGPLFNRRRRRRRPRETQIAWLWSRGCVCCLGSTSNEMRLYWAGLIYSARSLLLIGFDRILASVHLLWPRCNLFKRGKE